MLVSIIIPCFNSEHTIRHTLQSVYSQSSMDYEIIAIDDGSSDNTLRILQEESREHNNFKVISIPNGGVSTARNVGLEAAKGEFVYFLDSDDRISEHLVNTIINTSPFDILVLGYEQHLQQNSHVYTPHPTTDYLKSYLEGLIKIHMCSIVFNNNFIKAHNIKFDKGTAYSEDREFIIKALFYAKNIKSSGYVGFHYIIRENSAMSKTDLTLKRLTSLDALERCYKFLKETKYNSAMLAYFKTSIYLIKRMANKKSSKSQTEASAHLKYFIDRYCGQHLTFSFNKYGLFSLLMDVAFICGKR